MKGADLTKETFFFANPNGNYCNIKKKVKKMN